MMNIIVILMLSASSFCEHFCRWQVFRKPPFSYLLKCLTEGKQKNTLLTSTTPLLPLHPLCCLLLASLASSPLSPFLDTLQRG